MELTEAIRKRRSVRKFQDRDVPDLSEAIDLAQKGPSAGAVRGWSLAVTREQLTPYQAPCHVVVCCRPNAYRKRYGQRGAELYAVQDATIVAAYLQLLLVDVGLASVWVGAFSESRVRRVLQLGSDRNQIMPIAVLAVGYEA